VSAISWALLGLATGWVVELVHEDELTRRRRVCVFALAAGGGASRRHAGRGARARLVQPDQVRELAYRDWRGGSIALDPRSRRQGYGRQEGRGVSARAVTNL
jgi:hypothetical protein